MPGLLGAGGAFLLWLGFKTRKNVRFAIHYLDEAPRPAGSVVPGRASVEGVVVRSAHGAPRPERAPLSNEECAAWQVAVEELSGGRNARWNVVERFSGGVPFGIEDASGVVLVDPGPALVSIPARMWGRDTDQAKSFFADKEIATKGIVLTRKLRLLQRVVPLGAKAFVSGMFDPSSAGPIAHGTGVEGSDPRFFVFSLDGRDAARVRFQREARGPKIALAMGVMFLLLATFSFVFQVIYLPTVVPARVQQQVR